MSTAEHSPGAADQHDGASTFEHYNLDSRDPNQVKAGLMLLGLQRSLDLRKAKGDPVTLGSSSSAAHERGLQILQDSQDITNALDLPLQRREEPAHVAEMPEAASTQLEDN